MPYSGPKRIVLSGGGLAGLVCADAVTAALAEVPSLPTDLRLVVLGEGDVGSSPGVWRGDDPALRALQPLAPARAPASRGLRFLAPQDEHARRYLADLGVRVPQASWSCAAWLGPPDVSGGPHARARVVVLRALDPARAPGTEDERAASLARLLERGGPVAAWLDGKIAGLFGQGVTLAGMVSALPVLFEAHELSPGFRWGAAVLSAIASAAMPEDDNRLLRSLLDGRPPSEVDAQEIVEAVFARRVLPGLAAAKAAFSGPTGSKLDAVVAELSRLGGDDVEEALAGALPLVELLAADAQEVLAGPSFDVRASALRELYLGGGQPFPFGLDGSAALSSLRRRRGAPGGASCALVDDAAVQRAVRALCERVASRLAAGGAGELQADTFTSRFLPFGERFGSVEVTDNIEVTAAHVPTVRAARRGIPTGVLEADLIVAAHKPQVLSSLLEQGAEQLPGSLRASLRRLALATQEPLSLRLFFPQKLALLPGDDEDPAAPRALHGLDGPFHTVIDLHRALGEEELDDVALGSKPGHRGPYGSALELTGTWASLFHQRIPAHEGRAPWPPAVRELVRRLSEDPSDFEPATVDRRVPLGEGGARLPAPMLGEVKALERTRYLERFIEETAVVVVATALEQLAALPHLHEDAARALEDEARRLQEARHPSVRYLLWRGCRAEERELGAAPSPHASPRAGEALPVEGLVLAGGAFSPAHGARGVEAEVSAGLAAASAVLAAMREGGLALP